MNSKKNKNKNRSNKPSNPNPPQKVEDVNPIEKELHQNPEIKDISSKAEEPVPELISELTSVLTKSEEKADETPKKPKRNRGKKKNNNSDETEEVLIESHETNVQIQEIETDEVMTASEVAPNARKKKNKGKKCADIITTDEKDKNVVVEEEINKPNEVIDEAKDQVVSTEVISMEQEPKPSKNKNKKKKHRNDSEKSEKADELTCVAAFQKILKDEKSENKTENTNLNTASVNEEAGEIDCAMPGEKNINPELKKEDTANVAVQEFTESSKGKKKNKKDKKYPPTGENTKNISDPTPESAEKNTLSTTKISPVAKEENSAKENTPAENVSLDENISKPKAIIIKPIERKPKGDSKTQIKGSLSESTMQDVEIPVIDDKTLEHQLTVEDTQTEDKLSQEKGKLSETSTPEFVPKSMLSAEVPLSTDNEKGKKRKKSPKPKKYTDTIEIDKTPLQLNLEANISTEKLIHESQLKPTDLKESIEVTNPSIQMHAKAEYKSDNLANPVIEKNNQRKKSPKPKKLQESSQTDTLQGQSGILKETICAECTIVETATEYKPEDVKSKGSFNVTTPYTKTGTAIVAQSDLVSEEEEIDKKRKQKSKHKKHHQTIESDATQVQKSVDIDTKEKEFYLETEVILEEKKPEQVVECAVKAEVAEEGENKTNGNKKKKQKKSPKLPMEPQIESKATLLEEAENKDCLKEDDDFNKDKTESSCSLPSQDEIEISSLKAEESEGSTCGVTPDLIQYPRATSQELIDDNNNNMIIQEITVIEETRLEIPAQIPDTPLICGSGETPLVTPEIEVPCSKILKESEKTDLKSKMIEVNQDMEELRLSIEKSLAELTSIEKNEEEHETEFADKMFVITEESFSMPNPNVAKSETEKIDTTPAVDKIETAACLQHVTLTRESSETDNTKLPNKDMDVKMPTTDITPLASIKYNTDTTKIQTDSIPPPICPARKDQKNKGKSKKKGKQDDSQTLAQTDGTSATLTTQSTEQEKTDKESEKLNQKDGNNKEKSKQQTELKTENKNKTQTEQESLEETAEFEPIDNFEDAMTSSADDINKSFEMIANDENQIEASHVNPEINIIAPIEDKSQDKRDEKVNPLSQPKNLLGHPDIPVPSNRMDYKKEKNKSPNETLAKVKIKDSIQVEAKRQSKESQTDNIRKFMKNKTNDESFSLVNENDEFVYKYSFRKVFLQSSCHVCKKELKQSRVPCCYCCLVFYCSGKHKDEDWAQHQALCFAISTISHLKDQKHIYADAKNVTGQNYRLLRMQMIVSCEKVLKRRLVPWEQEALLYPRICADVSCREWRQSKLIDCEGCGQISYCVEYPDHFPKSHQRWCKSYSLYQKLVSYQQTKGRLEPKLPSKIITDYQIPEKMNEVLASMYEEKIDMSDIQYATLTQIATAPLTAAYCYQMARVQQPYANGTHKKTSCTIHVVDAELQFEADALNKWEVFFLHLAPVDELRVVMISAHLNPGNLPLELLSKIKLCESCRVKNRKVIFNFQDRQTYYEYWAGEDYITPNLVCAFNTNINRSALYNIKDPWPKIINCILKQKVPFLITAHTLNELIKDFARIKESAEHKYDVIVEPKINNFASVRPDRNFISDDEMPLLFKNYCFALLLGVN